MQLMYLGSRAQFGNSFPRLIEVCPNYENSTRVSLGEVKRGHRHLLYCLSSLWCSQANSGAAPEERTQPSTEEIFQGLE